MRRVVRGSRLFPSMGNALHCYIRTKLIVPSLECRCAKNNVRLRYNFFLFK